MSHPNPTEEYEEPKKRKRLSPSQLKSYSNKLLKEGGVTNRAKHEALLKKKEDKTIQHFKDIKEHVSGGKKSGGFNDPFWYKGKETPKYGKYGNKRPGMRGQSPNLPPGYKQSDLE